jgi:hypothetical protein
MDHNETAATLPPPPTASVPWRALGILVFLALMSSSIPFISGWVSSQERSGQDLTAAQARSVVVDPSISAENRRRAMHRLNKSIQANIDAMILAQDTPALKPHVRESFATFKQHMDQEK